MNSHQEQHCSDRRRTPEVLAVQGTGERELVSGPRDEGNNSIPSGPTPHLMINLSQQRRDLLKRYGLALALSTLALFLRGVLPFGEGVAPYAFVAPCPEAWYGGRGPWWLRFAHPKALVLVRPPVHSFQVSSDHALASFSSVSRLSPLRRGSPTCRSRAACQRRTIPHSRAVLVRRVLGD